MVTPMSNRVPEAKGYATLPFVPMIQTTQEGPPPPLPFVPIEVYVPLSQRLAQAVHNAWYRWALDREGLEDGWLRILL